MQNTLFTEAMALAERIKLGKQFENVSIDTLFLAAFSELQRQEEVQKKTRQTVAYRPAQELKMPSTFPALMTSLAGQTLTASQVYRKAFNASPNLWEAKQIGGWIRSFGHIPRKSNGSVVFDL